MVEENGHSQFIVELLKNKKNLSDFLNIINFEIGFKSDVTITFEEQADTKESKGRIDIFLTDGTNALLIENKINANDQPKQLERYSDWATKQNFKFELYYLSPYGSNPSKEGLGKLQFNDIKIISYSKHIREWLTKCLEEKNAYEDVLNDYLKQWNAYLSNDWSNEAKNLYHFFEAISQNQVLTSLEYTDEPVNESHMPLIIKGNFDLGFTYQGKEVKLTYDANENDIFLRMTLEDFETSGLKKDGWKKSGQHYDYIIYSIKNITEEKFPFLSIIENSINNINKAFFTVM
jgi:hypothetical protein